MKKTFVLFLFVFLSFIISGCGDDNYEVLSSSDASEEVTVAATEQAVRIGVYVCGEVMKPGMYYFDSNARVEDAIEAAGGITANAVIDSMNLAAYVNDCDKVYVPAFGEDIEALTGNDEPTDNRIDINRATLDELMTLPGIGQSKAQSIIDYRTEQGGYTSIEDIMNITGIKEGVFNKIKDLIKV